MVALVTKDNSGIGRSAALMFSELGAKVVVAARREHEGNAFVQEIRDSGGYATFLGADVSPTDPVHG